MRQISPDWFAETLRGIDEPEDIGGAFAQYLEVLGFSGYCYVLMDPAGTIEPRRAVFGSGLADLSGSAANGCWATHYMMSALYRQDPFVALVRDSRTPVAWRQAEPTPQLQRIVQQARNFGVADAIGVAIHGANDVCEAMALLYTGRMQGVLDAKPVDVLRAQLSLYQMHLKCRPLLEQRARDVAPGRLTLREREVFNWVARGKSNWEIAQILKITERTVSFHVENARKKVGAVNRMQTLVELILSGEIDLN